MNGAKDHAVGSVFGPEQQLPDGRTRVVLSRITVHGVAYDSHRDRDMISLDGQVVGGACRSVVGTAGQGFLLFGDDPDKPIVSDAFEDFKLAKLAASDDCYEALCLAELAQPSR